MSVQGTFYTPHSPHPRLGAQTLAGAVVALALLALGSAFQRHDLPELARRHSRPSPETAVGAVRPERSVLPPGLGPVPAPRPARQGLNTLVSRGTPPAATPGSAGSLPYLDVIGASATAGSMGTGSVLVAIVDSGVDVTHPGLAGHIWEDPAWRSTTSAGDAGACLNGRNGCAFVSAQNAASSCGYYSNAPTGSIMDDHGHGTFVAGIVLAAAEAAGDKKVRILPVKVLDCTGEGRASQAAAGVRYAARAGARVIVLSFAGPSDTPTLREAVDEARIRYGALVVASAGNDGSSQTQFPAGYPGVLGVGGTGIVRAEGEVDYLHMAPFSNKSDSVSLLAPSVHIKGPVPRMLCGHHDWTCVDGEPYAYASGTSYATPLVAAAAALLFAHEPDLTPDQVARRLIETARPVEGSLAGQVDIAAALAHGIAEGTSRTHE